MSNRTERAAAAVAVVAIGATTYALAHAFDLSDSIIRWAARQLRLNVEALALAVLVMALAGAVVVLLRAARTRRILEREIHVNAASRTRLDHIVGTGSVVIFSCKPSGSYRATVISENVAAILGYEAEVFLKDDDFWARHIHPDDMENVHRGLAELPHRGTLSHEYRFRGHDGSYRWLRDELRFMRDENGEPLEIQGHSMDVTEQRVAEDALRETESRQNALLRGIPDLMLRVRRDGSIVGAHAPNPNDLSIAPKELIHHDVNDVIPATPADLHLRHIAAAFDTGAVETYEFELTRDGEKEHYEGRIVVSVEDEAVFTARNITPQRTMERELRKLHVDLARETRLSTMGEMAAAIAHELNQPLVSIAHYGEACRHMLENSKGDTELVIDHLEKLTDQAVRAGHIVRRVRSFTGKDHPERVPTNLNDLIRNTVPLLDVESRRAGARLESRLAPELPDVTCDPLQIQQVLVNLVRNAIEAVNTAPEEERHVVIESSGLGDDAVRVAVIDPGEALSASSLEQIFEPFYTTKSEGLGLGLSISRSLIESHGGRLDAQQNGRLTTVVFVLPTDDRKARRREDDSHHG